MAFFATLLCLSSVAWADERWVASDRLNRRTCPSTDCGVVGQLFFREGVNVLEERDGWARISNYYDAACQDERSLFVETGNAACSPANGIENGSFAEWVLAEHLTNNRPPDPGADASGTAKLISQSDDFRKYRAAFTTATDGLIADGRCTVSDFEEMGGWIKSVNRYRDQPVYFTYCGGSLAANRIYLNAITGELFR